MKGSRSDAHPRARATSCEIVDSFGPVIWEVMAPCTMSLVSRVIRLWNNTHEPSQRCACCFFAS